MEFNLADLFENAVDRFPDRPCIITETERCTFAEMDARANRLAHHLSAAGIGPGDHVGIYALNCKEWVETLWAVFKIRAVWININFRYVEDELRYIFDNADLKALVYHRQYAPQVAAVRDCMPAEAPTVVIEDGSDADHSALGSAEYEKAMAAGSPDRDFPPRSADDLYILYTGGTTGMPKGVVWRHEDVFFALGGGIDSTSDWVAAKPEDMAPRGDEPGPRVFLSIAPLMHGASQWSVMAGSFIGRTNVLIRKFDPVVVWQLVEREKIEALMITGDAMGRPLIEALDGSDTEPDLSTLMLVTSTAALFSPTVKDDFFERFPNMIIVDGVGASEAGNNGVRIMFKGGTVGSGGGPTFKPVSDTCVLDEDLRPVAAGSGKTGKIARKGHIPLAYYKDPEKTAATFVTAPDGIRYSIPGDFARVEEDGNITLLGRGSVSINSGGEKIFPEEVESAIKSHADAYDALVVGVPDERWGSRVAAVIKVRQGSELTLEQLQEHCRAKIAGYKVPRELHLVDEIVRSPSGKPDYPWALRVATGKEPKNAGS